VAEKTGYPKDMLDLDLDLEADLGVDTVKQAELFATVRESYGIPRDDKLKLRDFPTLRHVIRFVTERSGAAPAAPDAEPAQARASVQAPVPEPEPQPAAAPAAQDEITEKVLDLVAEKTGYPKDMLDLDLDLEADLGVDTVKQAELFATIRESYGIPRDDKLRLRDFPTLRHVIGFMRERSTVEAPAAPAEPPVAQSEQAPAAGAVPAAAVLEAADRMPRRIPLPVLRPPLSQCKPTGIRLTGGARVVVVADHGGTGRALARRMKKIGVESLLIEDASNAAELTGRVQEWSAAGPVTGVYWLPALDVEPDIEAMDHATWKASLARRVKLLHAAMRALGDSVGGPGTFLVSGTRLGGRHGYGPEAATAPMGGAVSGFTKAYKRERPEALVKVVDFEAGRKPAEVAAALVEETLTDPGAVEIGRHRSERWTITLDERGARGEGLRLGPESVFVVTGAAGSIVAAIVGDLAAASGGTFHLLDLTAEPDPAAPNLARFATDREGLKRDIAERMRAAGERPTPAMVERRLAALERSHAALTAISAVRAAGGQAYYHQVDLTDVDAVAAVMAEVRDRHGRVDVMVHAAGLEISRLLPDKDEAQFALVLDVKCDGWYNLIKGAGDTPIGATVVFSSVAGRFGNAGQTDYSAANDLLCKYASAFRRTHPDTKAIAIDWTAWAGIGMASRGSIPKMMEMAGIEMLPPESGVPTVRRELTANAGAGEVVVAGRLGVLTDEFDPTGGVDPEAAAAAATGAMIGRVLGMGVQSGLRVETAFDPKEQAFLYDHRIEGTPVLPGVMGVEAFAEIAQLPLPKWAIAAVEDVAFLAPFKFYRDEPRSAFLEARFEPDGEDVVARCRLVGVRKLTGREEPQESTHFEANVRLRRSRPALGIGTTPIAPQDGRAIGSTDIYQVYFHGPAYQVLDRAGVEDGRVIGLPARDLPDDHTPSESRLVMQPRLIELCFQTAGVWELGTSGRHGLPARIDRVTVAGAEGAQLNQFTAVVTPHGDGFDAAVVDGEGRIQVQLEGYRTVLLPNGPEADLLKPFQGAAGTGS